jgi:hypothetical protein
MCGQYVAHYVRAGGRGREGEGEGEDKIPRQHSTRDQDHTQYACGQSSQGSCEIGDCVTKKEWVHTTSTSHITLLLLQCL